MRRSDCKVGGLYIDPKHIVLFLENIPSLTNPRFSYDKVLFEEKVFYILNDFPRTERWIEVKQ